MDQPLITLERKLNWEMGRPPWEKFQILWLYLLLQNVFYIVMKKKVLLIKEGKNLEI